MVNGCEQLVCTEASVRLVHRATEVTKPPSRVYLELISYSGLPDALGVHNMLVDRKFDDDKDWIDFDLCQAGKLL